MKNLKMRVLSLVLTLVMVLTGASFTNTTYGAEATAKKKAETFTFDGAKYKVTNAEAKEVALTGMKDKKATELFVPEKAVNNGEVYFVTSIAAKALKGYKKLASVEIGRNVTTIGKNAFQGDKKLAEIKIYTQSLTEDSVGKGAFKDISKAAVAYAPEAAVESYGAFLPKKGQKKLTVEKMNTDTVILYTNDVHCAVDAEDGTEGTMGYAELAAYKKKVQAEGKDVILVDNGDAVQGSTMGAITYGDAIINIMNEVGYDLAIPGNHDFDFGLDKLLGFADKANYEYISSNFKDLRTDSLVFKPYVIKKSNGRKIAFIGATTPEAITKSTPTFFMDEAGNLIYGFCGTKDGQLLYDTVQTAIDGAKAEGADLCILMSHLGVDEESSPWMSTQLIANTTGLDIVLDGHSHTVMEKQIEKDKNGNDVILTQTGTKMVNIGQLTLAEGAAPAIAFVNGLTEKDETVEQEIKTERAAFKAYTEQKAGTTDFQMFAIAEVEENGDTRIVRMRETNLGDFCADAFRTLADADIGLMNGGGIRANLEKGDFTYGDVIAVSPFLSNELYKIKVSGQKILDALELSVRKMGEGANGGYLQVSGITFDVDTSVESAVKLDETKMFDGYSSDARRVSNVKVGEEALDPEKIYTVAGTNYTLHEKGDGYSMFADAERDDSVAAIPAMQVLINYVESMGGTIDEKYADPNGQGRINVVNSNVNASSSKADITSFEKLPTAA